MRVRNGPAWAAELAAAFAWAWLLPCPGPRGCRCEEIGGPCAGVQDEELRSIGGALLTTCAEAVRAAAEAALEGTAPEQVPRFGRCLELADQPFVQAFQEGPLCAGCPESCALALLVQAVSLEGVDGTAQCSQTLLLLVRAFNMLEGVQTERAAGLAALLVDLVDKRRAECADLRRRELERETLPGATSDALPPAPGVLGGARAGPGRHGRDAAATSGRVAVLVASTPSMIRVYQPFINLWRCYALRHGLDFILETDDTEVSQPHRRAPNWMRWFAALRQLRFYAALLVVDPDQFVVPECWNVSIPAVLGAWAGAAAGGGAAGSWAPAPDIATRDFGRPQTLNNGVVLVRSSPRGFFFLEQLLAKAAWMQTIEKDQGAFDETVLEVLGLEAAARGEQGYNSECAQYVFPNVKGNHEIALYALCWWRASERLAGPFGSRRSSMIRFADPRVVDVNHVVGARGLAEPAVLHHFAGRSKDWDAMLRTFGMERRNTGDCRRVFAHVDAAAGQRACVPGGPSIVECEPPMLVC